MYFFILILLLCGDFDYSFLIARVIIIFSIIFIGVFLLTSIQHV